MKTSEEQAEEEKEVGLKRKLYCKIYGQRSIESVQKGGYAPVVVR